ncbi:MAG: hypothetical protein Unbinned1446contig1004_39 [Prokaryotic dsDNA virus sp.]|nr:MAG: hypothetical protein Unbinned1446contig1004_39 [Prokaryotic dsDNA virus sp.]|tara:strand:- start:3028 stop:3387 length:360 start_codon:yes stop_codon:yes gene_type:complete
MKTKTKATFPTGEEYTEKYKCKMSRAEKLNNDRLWKVDSLFSSLKHTRSELGKLVYNETYESLSDASTAMHKKEEESIQKAGTALKEISHCMHSLTVYRNVLLDNNREIRERKIKLEIA